MDIRRKLMIRLKKLVNFLDEILDIKAIPGDSSNNGLQVQGDKEIRKAVFGVHGLSWGSSLKYITGSNSSRLTPIIKNGISLYAAHLPLDMHPKVGHNALIADMIGLVGKKPFFKYDGVDIGVIGLLKKPMKLNNLNDALCRSLRKLVRENSSPYLFKANENGFVSDNTDSKEIKRVAVVSGGAGTDGVLNAVSEDAGCLITGEFGHSSYFAAREAGLSVIAPGHYITETPGVIGIMKAVRKEFPALEVEFVDIPTGL
jgi:dinuclear metal center YbgI/SA1388 family protein